MKYEIKPLNMGQAFGTAFSLYWNNFLFLFISAAVIQATSALATLGVDSWLANLVIEGSINQSSYQLLNFSFILIFGLFFGGLLTCLTTLFISRKYLGDPGKARSLATGTIKGIPGVTALSLLSALFLILIMIPLTLILYGILSGVAKSMMSSFSSQESAVQTITTLTYFLFAIIGMVVMVFYLRMFYAYPIFLVERKGVWTSFKRSFSLSKGNRGRLFVFMLAYMAFIVIVYVLVIQLTSSNVESTIVQVASVVIYALATPFFSCGTIALYFSARAEKEGFALERLVEEFNGAPAGGASASVSVNADADADADSNAVADAPKGEGNA